MPRRLISRRKLFQLACLPLISPQDQLDRASDEDAAPQLSAHQFVDALEGAGWEAHLQQLKVKFTSAHAGSLAGVVRAGKR